MQFKQWGWVELYLVWWSCPQVPGLWSPRCIASAFCELLTADSSTSTPAVFFWRQLLHRSMTGNSSKVLTPRVGTCAYPSKKKKSGVWSSISGSTPPIDSLRERRIGFILHNAPLNFTAQPKPNQFSLFDLLLCQNQNNVHASPVRHSP